MLHNCLAHRWQWNITVEAGKFGNTAQKRRIAELRGLCQSECDFPTDLTSIKRKFQPIALPNSGHFCTSTWNRAAHGGEQLQFNTFENRSNYPCSRRQGFLNAEI